MTDLIKLDEYKKFAEIGASVTQGDARLSYLITLTSEFIENYCGRVFSTASHVEQVKDDDTFLFVRNIPITTLTSVEYFDAAKAWTVLDVESYMPYLEDGQIELIDVPIVYAVARPYRLTYTGGYANIPADLKLAALDLVTYYYKRESAPKKAASDVMITTPVVEANNLPAHIKRVLDLYRAI